MNILVIKQTSLGDVLHSTGHVRAIKENFPAARLHLLTTPQSAAIYANNPAVDAFILYDHRRVKREWRRRPAQTFRYVQSVFAAVRAAEFEAAFDLQGLARSAAFLYAARVPSRRKFVKGNWPGLHGFRDKSLHAIAEMDAVLRLAGVAGDTRMAFYGDDAAEGFADELLARVNPDGKPLLVLSPFSRWASKDWPLQNYAEVAARLAGRYAVAFTGTGDARARIDALRAPAVNLAGELELAQFAAVLARARLLVCGDSFPMHLACALGVPVLALFAPTDERRTGPVGEAAKVIRAPGCLRCDRAGCGRGCLARLSAEEVAKEVRAMLTNRL